jgi:hypothetical protein
MIPPIIRAWRADGVDITAKKASKTGQGGEPGMNGVIDPFS